MCAEDHGVLLTRNSGNSPFLSEGPDSLLPNSLGKAPAYPSPPGRFTCRVASNMNLLSFRHLQSSAAYYEKDPLETCIPLNLRSCPSEKRGQERGSTQKLSIQQFVWEEKDGMFVKWSPITKKTKPTSQALPALQVLSCGKIWMQKWRGEREPSCGVETLSGRGLS